MIFLLSFIVFLWFMIRRAEAGDIKNREALHDESTIVKASPSDKSGCRRFMRSIFRAISLIISRRKGLYLRRNRR